MQQVVNEQVDIVRELQVLLEAWMVILLLEKACD